MHMSTKDDELMKRFYAAFVLQGLKVIEAYSPRDLKLNFL
jgi:hypothetical protein